jgi:hypothetical protein
VSANEPVSYTHPLDLLRRFAPTPLKAHVHLEFASVLLETNDLSFLPSLSSLGLPAAMPCAQLCLWKIVRDVDVRGKTGEASIVMAGNVIAYSMGPPCLIGADREHREILAFIGLDVDARFFQDSILPALCRLTEFVTRQQETPVMVQATEIALGGQCNA